MARGKDDYHHGDLRQALVDEAMAMLEQGGPDAVTFRGLARRVGVSHAAPGYHFADRDALLIALASIGHELLADSMESRLEADPDNALSASGKGYLDFALENPQLFRLMFGRIDPGSCEKDDSFNLAASRSGSILLEASTPAVANSDEDVVPWLQAWALVHGLATLWNDGALGEGFAEAGGLAAYRASADRILEDAARRPL